MRRFSAKLHSVRGTSMLIALFFFLICLTAGAIVLTSATASAAKERNRYQEQQAYLAVSSAARLLKKQLSGSSYVVTAVPYDTGKKDADGNEIWKYRTETAVSPSGGNLLTDNILESGSTDPSATGSYTVAADGAGDSADGLRVNVTYTMDSSTKKATFLLTDAKTQRYSMRVVFCATSTAPDELGQFGIYWDGGTITKGANSNA